MPNAGKIAEAIANLAEFILQYAVALAAVSALSMALVEAYKSLFKSRERYHQRSLFNWFMRHAPVSSDRGDYSYEKAYAQVIMLTTGVTAADLAASDAERRIGARRGGVLNSFEFVPENALFTLELEKMMGQLQDAADIALNNPKRYPDLYSFVTAAGEPDDIKTWRETASSPKLALTQPTEAQRVEAKEVADCYARLSKSVRRRLDSFQLLTGYSWAQTNQLASILVGFVLMAMALYYLESLKTTPELGLAGWLRILVPAALGGVAAPAAKDLVVALKKVRSGG